jgi:hypothetical protein
VTNAASFPTIVTLTPNRLWGRTIRHVSITPDASHLFGLSLSQIIGHAFGGPPPELILFSSNTIIDGGGKGPLVQLLESFEGHMERHGPQVPEGDTLRAFQWVCSDNRSEFRANYLVAGELCVKIMPPTEKNA